MTLIELDRRIYKEKSLNMPKRSKEDTEITIQKIMDAVVDQLLRLGYDKMSYTTLSQQTNS